METKVLQDSAELVAEAISDLSELLAELRETKSEPTILLTGGTLGIEFVKALGASNLNLDGVTFIFGDERYVPLSHPDRNEQQALEVFPALNNHLTRYPEASGDLSGSREEFDQVIGRLLGPIQEPTRAIDLTILGMGPDGHIASLFPGAEHEGTWIVSEADSPKPPGERLSFSYRGLSSSERVWFLVSGSGKADALRDVIRGELPAARVTGKLETRWYLDREISDAL